ncbi:MAG: hypothetical protein CMF52_05870 [Legionellales bacterium]|nr:hypothetical protein [Legionellales bacterium]|tara:strand:+ start:178 stop:969 length:792 start_codon:yes stop_codon:yes gene_type:complete
MRTAHDDTIQICLNAPFGKSVIGGKSTLRNTLGKNPAGKKTSGTATDSITLSDDSPSGPIPKIGYNRKRLNEGEWLDDTILNRYRELINNTCAEKKINAYVLNTQFYTKLQKNGIDSIKKQLQKTDKKTDENSFRNKGQLLIPINVYENHWCCGVIDFKNKVIFCYDSLEMYSGQVTYEKFYITMIDCLKTMGWITPDEWERGVDIIDPKQTNGVDCGVFLSQFMKYYSVGKPLHFTQAHINGIRAQMRRELDGKKLEYELPN